MIDLLVAGAGPSGLSAAIAAAARGMQVVVVDPHQGTIDKACGEGLMPAVVEALTSLGVTPARSRPFTGIRYLAPGVTAHGHFTTPALGVRRTALHEALQARADAVGVRRVVGRIDAITQLDDRVRAGGFEARWLIAADGLRSPTRHHLGLDVPQHRPRRFGLRQHFAVAPWSDTVDVHWAPDAEAYVTPVADDLVGVAFLFGEAARIADRGLPAPPTHRLMARFPELAARLTEPASIPRGAGPFEVLASRRVAGRVLLVGDAAGYIDPLTGEGTKLGVVGAMAAVAALHDGEPQRWEAAWRQLWRPYAWSTRGLLTLSSVPVLRRALPRVLAASPWLFDRALGVLAR